MDREPMGSVKGCRSYAGAAAIVQAALLLGGCEARDEVPARGETAAAVSNAAAAAPAPNNAAAVPVAGPKRTVLAFGDSLYAGYGLRRGESLPDAIQARLRAQGIDATVVNAGVSGETTAAGRRRLAYTLDRQRTKPDLVLLGLGGNDVLRLVDPAETRANLVAMLAELKRRDIPVVLTGMIAPPNLGPAYAGRFNAIFPELAHENGAVLDPFILAGVIGNRQLMLPDGVHPNARGVERMADRLAPLVQTQLTANEAAE